MGGAGQRNVANTQIFWLRQQTAISFEVALLRPSQRLAATAATKPAEGPGERHGSVLFVVGG